MIKDSSSHQNDLKLESDLNNIRKHPDLNDSLLQDAPLGSVFSQYVFGHKAAARKKKVCFQFDGCTVSPSQTPAELDMEDGDIIEVWA